MWWKKCVEQKNETPHRMYSIQHDFVKYLEICVRTCLRIIVNWNVTWFLVHEEEKKIVLKIMKNATEKKNSVKWCNQSNLFSLAKRRKKLIGKSYHNWKNKISAAITILVMRKCRTFNTILLRLSSTLIV